MEMSSQDWREMKAALRDVLEEELGFGRCNIARKWDGGKIILKPSDDSMQSKEIPIDVFFKKITSVREKLRVLEQKLNNNNSLSHEEKAEYQTLITRAYGSLTTFNVLFRYKEHYFTGEKS